MSRTASPYLRTTLNIPHTSVLPAAPNQAKADEDGLDDRQQAALLEHEQLKGHVLNRCIRTFQLWPLRHISLKAKHEPADHLPGLVLAAGGADGLAAELEQGEERLLASVQPAREVVKADILSSSRLLGLQLLINLTILPYRFPRVFGDKFGDEFCDTKFVDVFL